MKTLVRRPDIRVAMFAFIARRMLPVCVFVMMLAPAGASAAIVYRSTSTAENVSGSTSLTIPAPAGATTGDMIIASVDSAGAVPTPPAGWTAIGAPSLLPWGGSAGTWYRIVAAGEPASYTWGLGAVPVKAGGGMAAYSGVNLTYPIADNQILYAANSATATTPSVSPAAKNSVILVGIAYAAAAPTPVTIDPSTSSRWTFSTSGAGSVEGGNASDFFQASAAAAPTKTYTFPAPVTGWASQAVALTPAGGSLSFASGPNVPNLSSLTLSGAAQTSTAAMPDFSVDDETGSLAGWNVTVTGDTSGGKSPVFAQYCPSAACGADSGPGYVPSGRTLPASSLALDSSGATFGGGARGAPTLKCGAGCTLDTAAPTKVAAAAGGAGAATWTTTGFGASSLRLSTPSTLRALNSGEVYRADLVWSLNSGP